MESLTGKLLVATPMLVDRNFFRTVILLLAHDEEGALGVVLNRPSELELAEAMPTWAPHASSPPVVFVGGPVQPAEATICLGRAELGTEGFREVLGGVGTLNLEHDVVTKGIRLFAGYSGWSAGQLETELTEGAWLVLPAQPDDLLTEQPLSLWRTVLRRQRGNIALLSTYPVDPAMN